MTSFTDITAQPPVAVAPVVKPTVAAKPAATAAKPAAKAATPVAKAPPSAPAPVGGIIGASGEAPVANPFTSNGANVAAAYTTGLANASANGTNGAYTDPNAGYRAAAAAMTPAQLAAWNANFLANNHGGFFDTLNEYGPVALMAVGAAATGGAAGTALGGGLGGAIGGGAAGGAFTAEAGALGNAQLASPGQLAKGAVVGGVTGGLGYEAAPAANALNSATGIGAPASGAIVKGAIGAGTGALGSALNGGNIGSAALTGGVSGAISGGLQGAGASPTQAGLAAKVVGGLTGFGSAASPSPSNSNITNGINAGIGAIGTAGAVANGSNMATTGSNVTSGLGVGSTLLGAAGGVLNTIGGMQQSNANGNVLSLANAGTGVGTQTSFAGPNSTANINAGQVTTALNGGLNATNSNMGALGAQQSAIAGSFGNAAPASVQNAINSQSQQVAPTGTQGILGGQLGLQQAVQGSEGSLINSGTTALNNPLTANLQGAAQTQLGTAGQDFSTTYNNSLSALNAALVDPTAQAESQMADSQFERGQMGTSGGALQTQAFAKGLGQAYLGNQQTALTEAQNTQNSATTNAATLNNSANNNLSTANGLLANAYGQFNNTSQIAGNTANSIAGQNATISQLGNTYGQQNLNNQITGAALPAQLAGAYGANANAAVAGATGLNNIDLSGFQAALGAGTQQGNQYTNSIGNAAKVVSSGQSTNGLTSLGTGLSSIGGLLSPTTGSAASSAGSVLGSAGSLGSAFNSITGNSTNAYNAANGVPAGADVTGGIDYTDTSNPDLGFITDPSMDMDFGSF